MKRILSCFAALMAFAVLAPLLRSREPIHAAESPVTYSHQIAPVLYAHCTACHHPGGAGPFSLLTYQDAKRWGAQIVTVTQSHYMPPWLPEPGYGDFADSRRLNDSDLALLKRWVSYGMPSGDLTAAPKPPAYASQWQLGTPDLVLEVPEPFITPPSGTDVFRNFVLPYPLKTTEYIRAMEILPGAASVVHHANVLIDRTGSYRRQHPNEWQQGIPGMELVVDAGSSFDPDSHFLFWKPDSPVIIEPHGMEWRLDPGDDLILNMHLKPTGKPETIQAKIGLYFSRTPPTSRPMLLQLENDAALDIPPGDHSFAVDDELTLPIDVRVLGIYPHAHYLGKDLKAWAILPNGEKISLIWIRDWDIDRQSVYHYRAPVFLPKGSVVHMHYVYDNSIANPRNPHSPPVRVRAGNRSEDEMGHLWLQVLPVEPVVDGKDARLLLEIAWMQSRLRKDPNDAMALYNLAAAYSQDGDSAKAIDLYRRILKQNPSDLRTLTALGSALELSGQWQQAADAYSEALQADPAQNDARFDLAQLYLDHQQFAKAEQTFREYLRDKASDGSARDGLAIALRAEHRSADARAEFAAALAINANDVTALRSLGEMDLEDDDPASAIEHFKSAVQTDDDPAIHQELALAYAQSARPSDAAAELKRAIELQPKDATLHALLSQVEGSMGEFPTAISEQQIALALQPSDADGWNNLGVLQARSGNSAAARQSFLQALKISANHPSARANLERLDSTSK